MLYRLVLAAAIAATLAGCESPEEKEAKRVEQEALQKIQEEEKKQAFIDSLATSDNSEYLDFSKVTERALAGETEIQEEIHQSELVDKNWKLSGEVLEIDPMDLLGPEAKYGFRRVQIQLVERQGFEGLVATATCWVSDDGYAAIAKVAKGDSLTIYGEAFMYGDVGGLQLRRCTIPRDRKLRGNQDAGLSPDVVDTYLAANANKPGVQTTSSGLQFKIVRTGSGRKPMVDDSVEVHYEGRLINGTVFDSSYRRGQTVTFGVMQVIPGWTEALQLMSEGAEYELTIPPELAYGEAGAGDVIGPNEVLIFKVELVKVVAY